MVSRNLERANENDGFKMTALENLVFHSLKENQIIIMKSLHEGKKEIFDLEASHRYQPPKCKLAVYNFTMCEQDSKNGHCYICPETAGTWGALLSELCYDLKNKTKQIF